MAKSISIKEAIEKHLEISNKNFAKLNERTETNTKAVSEIADLISNMMYKIKQLENEIKELKKNNKGKEKIETPKEPEIKKKEVLIDYNPFVL